MEVYESHLGGIYFSDRIIDEDDLHCEQCGDWDWYLGHADTWEEVIELITEYPDEDEFDPWIPYAEDYLEEQKEYFEQCLNK